MVPLLVQEAETTAMRKLLATDRSMAAWALSGVEITSALWRRARSGELAETALHTASTTLAQLERTWHQVVDLAQVAARAQRLLAVHQLRAADACQLAAALVLCREQVSGFAFVTLDARLAQAARREGLQVLPEAVLRD